MTTAEQWIRTNRGGWVLCLAILVTAITPQAFAADPLAPLRHQFALPNERIDYAEAKLVVDKLIDPTTDVAAVRKEIDRWEQAVRANAPTDANARAVFDALVKTLYEPGPWNQHRPFGYDLDDPLGKNRATQRLSTYLATRTGNCISMPIFVVILGQRLGLPVALATAPSHVLVKFADDRQQSWINFESTAGGFKSDESIEREMEITPLAMENRIHLRPLTPKEGLGVIAGSLMHHYGDTKNGDAAMAVADLALAANPIDTNAQVWKGNAYFLQLQAQYVRRWPNASDIPQDLVPDYLRLSRGNLAWFAKAEALGWREMTPAQREAYLQSIDREKARRGK